MIITNAETGGIQGNSTAHQVDCPQTNSKKITSIKQTAYVVFLHVQKVYDKASLDAGVYILNKYGVEHRNLNVKNSMATSRPRSKPDRVLPKKYQSKRALDKAEQSL